MSEHINSWKNKSVFESQIILNRKELNGNYPVHWIEFFSKMKSLNDVKNILDVGCGTGAFYKLCKKEFPSIDYYGIDYSKEAIDLAKEENSQECFDVQNVNELTSEFIQNYDVILMNGLLAILPNGDEVLDLFLSKKPKNLIISRVKFTDGDSYYKVYDAYNLIKTYDYFHGKNTFNSILEKNNYRLDEKNNYSNTVLITRNY
jgi:trans-aconitate methyltransferase